MNLIDCIEVNAHERAAQPALITSRGRSFSFAEFGAEVSRLGNELELEGLCSGDRVLLMLPIGVELYISLCTLLRHGIAAVFLDPALPADRVNSALRTIRPTAIIASRSALLYAMTRFKAVRTIARRFVLGAGIPGSVNWYRASARNTRLASSPIQPEMPAVITLTSGSTATPKTAERNYGLLTAQYHALMQSLPHSHGTVELCTLPLFVLRNLVSGTTSLLPDTDCRRPDSIDAARYLKRIEQYDVSSIVASPALTARLFRECLRTRRVITGKTNILTGGGPVFPGLVEDSYRCLPNGELHVVYGATEAEPIAHIGAHKISTQDLGAMHRGRGLLVGKPVAAIDCRLIPEREPAEAIETITNEVERKGEIVVSGRHVLPAYVEHEATRSTKFDFEGLRWHRTGDAGFFDENGRLWLLGRCAFAGGGVYPFQVETRALSHPAVARAGYVYANKQKKLLIELQPGKSRTSKPALLDELGKLPIDSISILKHLPMDSRHNSKIDYPALLRQDNRNDCAARS